MHPQLTYYALLARIHLRYTELRALTQRDRGETSPVTWAIMVFLGVGMAGAIGWIIWQKGVTKANQLDTTTP